MKNIRIFLKGEDATQKIKYYKMQDGMVYIFFKNSSKPYIYSKQNIKIVQSALHNKNVNNCFVYLKEIAKAIGLKNDGDNILEKQYSSIGFIEEDSVLAKYLGDINEIKQTKLPSQVIYPFGFNHSQSQAVENALKNDISIVQGPPGTGKTQTILNIIANVVLLGKSVAVVSSNNAATKNVLDKLTNNGVGFIAAFLGNLENKQEFVNAQSDLPNLNAWHLMPDDLKALNNELAQEYKELHSKLNIKNELAMTKQMLSQVEIEQKHFLEYFQTSQIKEIPAVLHFAKRSEMALDFIFECENYVEIKPQNNFIKFFTFIGEYLKFWDRKRLTISKLLKENDISVNDLKEQFQKIFYDLKISELKVKVNQLEHEILSYDFDLKMKEYVDLSLKVFKSYLYNKYDSQKREKYYLTDLKNKPQSFINDYPVILSTTYSIKNSLAQDVIYDYVIIDEASQVDLVSGVLALACAKKAVIVGDLKQLPNVVDGYTARLTDKIFEKYDLKSSYRYKDHCLLSSVKAVLFNTPSVLLREHYRCHPQIIEFCNRKFYGNELIILSTVKSDKKPLVLCYSKAGNHERDRFNQRQIDIIKEEIIPQYNLNVDDYSLGIVTPYRNQTNALQATFKGTTVKADTVDKFQGQENKVIILSTVDNDISDFTDNPNRLNVAISRAIEQLIVIVSDKAIARDKNISDLINYIKYSNCHVHESKVHSIFDYLYKCYEKRRRELLAKQKRISEYDSENLMFGVIQKVLDSHFPNQFAIAFQVRLKTIIRDYSLLQTKREKQYALNDLTRIDFVVYKTIDNAPFLAIEVDGYKYHQSGTKQSERDELKNEILSRYNIPLIRFNTTGSREEKRLIEKINALLSDTTILN